MTGMTKQLFESIKELSPHERATLAHCLIASLDEAGDESVDDAWANVAQTRLEQLMSGEVSAVSWDEIRRSIKPSS